MCLWGVDMNIEDFKSIIDALQPLVGQLTDSAVIMAIVYIAFKLLIDLTVPLCVMFLIYKISKMIKSWASEKKVTVNTTQKNVVLDKDLITSDEVVLENIQKAFSLCRCDAGLFNSSYMHKEHSEFLLNAVKEKLDRDSDKTNPSQ